MGRRMVMEREGVAHSVTANRTGPWESVGDSEIHIRCLAGKLQEKAIVAHTDRIIEAAPVHMRRWGSGIRKLLGAIG